MQSGSWPVVRATVLNTDCAAAAFGCALAKVRYEYSFEGHRYEGAYEKPFISSTSGKIFAENILRTSDFAVRIRPGASSTSVPISVSGLRSSF
jgi:hypothetical protein